MCGSKTVKGDKGLGWSSAVMHTCTHGRGWGDRERLRERKGEEGEGQADSMLSVESDVGLDPTTLRA